MNMKARFLKRIAALLALALLLGSAPAALAEKTFSAVVSAASMDVYKDEKLTTPLGELKKYTVVQVASYTGGVAKISFNGITGYAQVSDMEAVSSFGKRALLIAASKIYASPNRSSKSATAPKGSHLYVLATSDGWALVEMNGNVGYVETDRLTEADEAWTAVDAGGEDDADDIEYQVAALNAGSAVSAVTTAKTPVYASASAKSRKLGTLKKGRSVKVLASNKSWAYIELNGNRGYCKVKNLKKASSPATVTTPTPKAIGTVAVKKLPVYRSASTKSKKLGTLKKGRTVNVLGWKGKWAWIELNGRYGYAALAGLKRSAVSVAPSTDPTPAPTPQPSLDNAVKAVVSASSATVFRAAAAGSAILGTLKQGTEVNLLAAEGDWALIELNGNRGYCKLSALTQKEIQTEVPSSYKKESFQATVVASGAKAYARPNTATASVPLTLGATVKVVAYSSDWACVSRSGAYAFVPVGQLSRASYTTVSGSGAALQTLLKALLTYGYYDGVPSTTYNSAAVAAIKRFQSACGLSQTGVADEVTQRILYGGMAPVSGLLTKALSSGAKGDSVTRLQTRLFALGYLSKAGSVDGDYGSKTAAAVSQFQGNNGLTKTGAADVATLRALYSLSAVSLASGGTAADETVAVVPTTGKISTYMTFMPGNTASKVTKLTAGMSNAKRLEYAIYVASTKLKCPYVYGATGPSKFDCSGLTQYCFKAIGVSLLRTAYQQGYNSSYGKIESVGSLKRGDLVFFNTVSDSDLCDHVGIYLGGGYFIHASSGGHKVVCSQLASGYYNRVFSWGRRILK